MECSTRNAWDIDDLGAGPLPPDRPIFSNTYNPVEAADSKPPFFRFEFVNRFRGERTSPTDPPADNAHSFRTPNGPLALSMSAG
jgi:hypothetical protein